MKDLPHARIVCVCGEDITGRDECPKCGRIAGITDDGIILLPPKPKWEGQTSREMLRNVSVLFFVLALIAACNLLKGF